MNELASVAKDLELYNYNRNGVRQFGQRAHSMSIPAGIH